jgi:hypothetical protein
VFRFLIIDRLFVAVNLYFIFDIPNIFKEKFSFFDNKLQMRL